MTDNPTETTVPVTQEEIVAALATFNGGLVRQTNEQNARGYTTFYHPKDSMRSVLENFALTRSTADKDARIAELLTDDPNWIAAGIPDDAIDAGIAAWDKANDDLKNYVSGVTPDWDEGMIVAAIFKAVLRQALKGTSNAD